MKSVLLAATVLTLVPSGVLAEPGHSDHQPGAVSFPISCNANAKRHFTGALSWLHSFEYGEAETGFQAAADADPRCAMAYWGVAMSNYHPLWAPPTQAELAKGQAAVARAKSLDTGTDRERGYIAAIDSFYADPKTRNHGQRTLLYLAAMEDLHRRFPDDDESATFHALALIAAGTMDADDSYAREKGAANILNGVLARQPRHPGVAHYLIHGYDYPALAHLALPAARAYAGLAPASAHAQHMPSHIFVRLGHWQDSIRSNLAAEAAAKAYARSQGMAGAWDEQLHAIDYLAYGYLQLAQDDKAGAVLANLNAIRRVDPPNFKAAYTFSAVPARFALERRRWGEAAQLALPRAAVDALPWARFPWAQAHIHFARAVGAARGGKIDAARRETAHLLELRAALPPRQGEYDWGKQVEIEHGIAAAWLAMAERRGADGQRLMRAAADLDDATEKHPVTPGAILPAREQLGELLLEAGKPAEALTEFESSLRRAPGRFNSIRGAARAASLAGSRFKATRYYAALMRVPGPRSRPEFQEAAAYLNGKRAKR